MNKPNLKRLSIRFSKYSASSLVTFSLDMLVFNLLFFFGIGVLLSHIASVLAAVAVSYLLMSHFVFEGSRTQTLRVKLLSFIAINALALAISSSLIWGVETLVIIGKDALLANLVKVASISFTAVLKFILYQAFTFR